MADVTYKRLDKDQLIFLTQYMFTKLKGSPLADNTTYTLEKNGNNILLKDQNGTTISTVADENTTYSDATTDTSGLMTTAMVTKLNGIAAGANKTTVDTALSASSANPVQNKVINTALAGKQAKLTAGTNITINGNTISAKDTTYAAASGTGSGLMTPEMVTKLAGIDEGAQKNPTIDTALSTTSTNAVQNKVVNAALNSKQDALTQGDNITIANGTISAKDTTYGAVTEQKSGLMTPQLLETLNNLKSFSDGGIAAVKVNGSALTITNNTVDITVPIDGGLKKTTAGGAEYTTAGYATAEAAADVVNNLKTVIDGQITDINTALAGKTTMSAVEAKGYQTSAQVESAITAKGYQTASQVNTVITGKGYQTASQVRTIVTGYGYQTAAQVQTAISGAGHLTREIVDALPAVAAAKENTIYMVRNTSTGDNKYDEYMLINGALEKIGDTAPDLSGYVKDSEMGVLTNQEITKVVDDAYTEVFG